MPPVERRDFLPDPGTKGLHLRRLPAPPGAHEMVGTTGGEREPDGYHKPAGAQVVIRKEIVCQQHAGAFTGCVEGVVAAVEPQPAAEVDPVDPGCRKPVGPGRHIGAVGEGVVMDQRRVREEIRRVEWSMRLDQSRAAHRHERQLNELFSYQCRIG